METVVNGKRKEMLCNLETFLRGMETPGRNPGRPVPESLETFLRGMETGARAGDIPRRVGLETFLRGMETAGDER